MSKFLPASSIIDLWLNCFIFPFMYIYVYFNEISGVHTEYSFYLQSKHLPTMFSNTYKLIIM